MVGIVLFFALAIVVIVGIIRAVIKVAFSLLGIAALIWLVLFILNMRIF
jgi:hypothetical protein